MAEAKTVPTDADVDEFLHAATPARRQVDGLKLAEIFHDVTGADPVLWGPSMVGYGTYRFVSPNNPRTRGDWPKTGFSPRKAQLSLYGLKDRAEGAALLPSLGTYTEGAGCVYVKKLDDIFPTLDTPITEHRSSLSFASKWETNPPATGKR